MVTKKNQTKKNTGNAPKVVKEPAPELLPQSVPESQGRTAPVSPSSAWALPPIGPPG